MAASGQRAFAQKLSKQGAAEVRKQISSTHYTGSDLARSISGLDLTVPINEVVDPLEFEDYVLQNQYVVERDPYKDLILYPEDDVEVHSLPKRCRTVCPVVPETSNEDGAHVHDLSKRYTADYNVVTRRYQRYSSSVCNKDKEKDQNALIQQVYEVDCEDATEKDNTNKRQSIHMNDTPRGSWASSIFDLKQSQADSMLPNLFDNINNDQIDMNNKIQREKNRQDSLYGLYNVQDDEGIVERREPATVPKEHFGHRILVKCLQLKLELDFEPLFATLALYDAKERKKISENFYFDLNSDETKGMIKSHITRADISTMSRSCIFSITYPSPDVFLVIRLEKVLQQGDISECAEPYMKEDKGKEDKYHTNAMQFCDRLGKYRMPFAWTAIYLMNIVSGATSLEREPSIDKIDSERTASLDRRSSGIPGQYDSFKKRNRDDSVSRRGSFDRGRQGYDRRGHSPDEYGASLDNFRPVTLTVSSFFKQEGDKLSDDDLYKFLADLKRPSSVLKRVKCIPGTLKLDISVCPEEPRCTLTPELVKVEPYPDDKNRPVKEILEFPTREVFSPYTTYRNLLYVYPRGLNFANRQGSARNIAVKVQFLQGEDENAALCNIFGKSNCPEMTKEAYTSVTYHNKSPYFYEEIKIKLPANLNDSHHLLFTFYHISCQTKKNEIAQTEVPVGYTWLPLVRDGRLKVGDFNIPVSVEKLPASYSALYPDTQLPGTKWIDNHKGVFSGFIHSVSSVHPQDPRLNRFLSFCRLVQEHKLPPRSTEAEFEKDIIQSLQELHNANGESLVQFLPHVLDKLILLMVKPPILNDQHENIGQPAFETLTRVVNRVHEELKDGNDHNGRNSLLASYIHFCSSLPHPSGPSLIHQSTVPNMHPSSGYNTLGRPSSLPVNKQTYHRSTSNPDLTGSTPTSPEIEMAGGRYLDRTGSMRGEEMYPGYFPRRRSKRLVHEEIVFQWLVLNGKIKEIALSNAWFLFELIIKSMAEHLAMTDKLNAPRSMRFHDSFMEDVKNLVKILIKDVTEYAHRDPELARSLNNSLAFFLHDLISYMDRGFVFIWIQMYCQEIYNKIQNVSDGSTLMLMRLDFMRIICSHEHFFPLNLPFGTPLTPSAGNNSPTPSVTSINSMTSYTSTSTLTDKGRFYELTLEFRQQHFLIGIVLSDLSVALDTLNPKIHLRAINVVSNLLYNHDLDVRYTDPEMKARLAALYLPLVGIVIEALPQLYYPNMEGRYRNTIIGEDEMDKIDQQVAMAIAGGVAGNRGQEVGYIGGGKARRCPLNAECTRNLLMCFMWVLKNADEKVLKQWWTDLDPGILGQILEVVYLAISNFEYKGKWPVIPKIRTPFSLSTETLSDWQESPASTGSRPKSASLPKSYEQLWEGIQRKSQDFLRGPGSILNRSLNRDDFYHQGKKSMSQCSQQTLKKSVDMKSRLEEVILGNTNARTEMMLRRKQVPFSPGDKTPPGGSLRWRKDQFQWRPPLDMPEVKQRDVEVDAHIEGSLAAEVSMIALDCLENIVQIAEKNNSEQALRAVLRVLLHSFGLNQSTMVLEHMFSTQRSLVTKYLDLLFEEETEQCADLCLRLLGHCSSSIANIRSQASASLYMLMRQNFERGNNFARVKMQVTMSLSSLVGQNENCNEEYLRRSLKTILTYAEADVELQETGFPGQVKDLVFNLHMILSDTVKMKEFQEDPEMLLDLMYRIAKGYQNSPDLRLTWLQNMASKHTDRGNHAEAAHCLVHAGGLIAEYLNMIEDQPYLPVGCVVFQKISSNVIEESAVSDDVVSPGEDGICSLKYFTEQGLIGVLEQAAQAFTSSGMYEAISHVYKVVTPIHEAHRDYKSLAKIHGKMQEAFNNVQRMEGKRLFATYFRVGFYGRKFGDLDGEEFIYKEPAITKLNEISHRLESFYGDRFGHDKIHIIKDSNTVEREKLDPAIAYMQITYVEPYFDLYEYKDRVTYFEKNYNIKRFMYPTPFTLDGRAHGEIHEQYKRKTILTTSHTFPYVKTRLPVIMRDQVILSPIEVAIEDLQKKTRELYQACIQEPPDTKILQMVLQGCIGTTVNQGPAEIAFVFLKPVVEEREVQTKHHNKLRQCFKDFMKKCYDALQKNRSLISQEMKEYQKELERNYKSMKDKLHPYISTTGTTLKRQKHHRKNRESPSKQRHGNSSEC